MTAPARRRGRVGGEASHAAQSPVAGHREPLGPDGVLPGVIAQRGGQNGRTWEIWFAANALVPEWILGVSKTGKPKRRLPRYPPNINERRAMHWAVERKAVAYWRGYAAREARRHQMPASLERVRISARVYRRALGVADGSGDAERLKPLVDGLVDAGVIADDTRRYVEHGPVEERRTSSHHRGDGILLIVEALEPASPAPGGRGGE